MKLTFSLINKTTGEFVTGEAANINILVNKDFMGYTNSVHPAVEISPQYAPGQYYVELTEGDNGELNVEQCLLVSISCSGCMPHRYRIFPEPEITVDVDTPDVPTAEEIAEKVWDEALSGHNTAGSAGAVLNSVPTDLEDISTDLSATLNAAKSLPTAQAVASAVWGTGSSSYTTAGTFGNILRLNPSAEAISSTLLGTVVGLNPAYGTVARYLYDILADTENIATIPHDVWTEDYRTLTGTVNIDSDDIATSLDVQHIQSQLTAIETKVNAIPINTASISDVTTLASNIISHGDENWSFDGLSNTDLVAIATSVLTTDMTGLTVTENAYTLKHLIMASQKSNVAELTETSATWNIYDTDGSTIAERELTLNDKGAIVDTQ